MSKGKKRCYFCQCNLTNENSTNTFLRIRGLLTSIWVACCHSCKSKKDKKP
jgi:hypothetical protein